MNAVILGYELDTNGQNARFTDASRRHGGNERVLKAMAIGDVDPGGVVARFQEASVRNDAGLTIRSAHRQSAYFDFPTDILWTKETEPEIARLVNDADVLHLNNSWRPADYWRKHPSTRSRFVRKPPMLLHHHGSLFRSNPEKMLAMAKTRKMQQCVSTIDLQRPAPDLLPWLPTAYNIDEIVAFGQRHARKPDGKVRIVHCPTNRKLKHTELLIRACDELQAEGSNLELVIVEGKTWRESLLAKAGADIVYDQLAFGYGCNSVEAWSLGKPVIAGADEWTLDRMAHLWPAIPFEEATEKTLKDVVRRMVKSEALREDAAERGHAHVRRYHDELPALERLAELYRDAINFRKKPRVHGKGVTFHSATRRSMTVDGQVVEFVKGHAVVTDMEVVRQLREFTTKRPMFGIEELT